MNMILGTDLSTLIYWFEFFLLNIYWFELIINVRSIIRSFNSLYFPLRFMKLWVSFFDE